MRKTQIHCLANTNSYAGMSFRQLLSPILRRLCVSSSSRSPSAAVTVDINLQDNNRSLESKYYANKTSLSSLDEKCAKELSSPVAMHDCASPNHENQNNSFCEHENNLKSTSIRNGHSGDDINEYSKHAIMNVNCNVQSHRDMMAEEQCKSTDEGFTYIVNQDPSNIRNLPSNDNPAIIEDVAKGDCMPPRDTAADQKGML